MAVVSILIGRLLFWLLKAQAFPVVNILNNWIDHKIIKQHQYHKLALGFNSLFETTEFHFSLLTRGLR